MNELLVDTQRFLAKACSQVGKPYLFGRKGPDAYDCSGLVTWALREAGGPDLRFTYSSQRMFEEFEVALRPAPTDVVLALYGFPGDSAPHVNHVMLTVGDGRVFGACGGDHSTLTLEAAKLRKAEVRFRPSVTYRPDFLGYRRLAYRLAVPTPGVPNA